MRFLKRARLRAGTGQPLGLRPEAEAGSCMWNSTFGGAKPFVRPKADNIKKQIRDFDDVDQHVRALHEDKPKRT